ncbi:MAG: M23 family metallopeptidase [Candidatus Limnocylindrales bacterium]
MHQASAAASRVLDRLAHLGKTPNDTSGAVDADPLAGLRGAAARLADRGGLERFVPIGICALLVLAALVSSLPEASPASAAARSSAQREPGAAPLVQYGEGDGALASDSSDLYLGDGSIPNTLQNPGVGTDATSLLRTYTVVAGDTLGKIAARFSLATATIYWANKAQLPDPSSLRVGQQLLIPPMDGLLVKVGVKDTLESLAAKYKVATQDIIDANNLPEPVLTVGQTLIIPGASGGPMPAARGATARSGWYWPVVGSNYVSQYFWSGHHALDIAADSGTPVVAAASGTVVLAGWRSVTGGGNAIWIMHGTKLYSTYNHLSYVGVHAGQKVSAGQRIGKVGMTGVATGPHLHFEVWLGYPWALGDVSDAVNPCIYLAGC